MSVSKNVMYYLLYDKPCGVTSFDALYPIKRALGTNKVGHTGTLDKFASGLLITLAGRALKLARFFSRCDKRYMAEVRFGMETDTLDPEGRVCAEAPPPGRAVLEAALERFRGPIMQSPPAYSAIHIGGKRAYELARGGGGGAGGGAAADVEGLMVERPASIYGLELLSYEDEQNSAVPAARAVIAVHCSSGTYIRSLARDIARACGSRAYLTGLRRTAIGGFSLAGERPVVAAGGGAAGEYGGFMVRTPDGFCFEKLGIPVIDVDAKTAAALCHGRPLGPILGGAPSDSAPRALFFNQSLVAVAEYQGGKWGYAFVCA